MQRRRRTAWATLTTALALVVGTLAPTQMAVAADAPVSAEVQINRTTTAGFTHPGIGVTADALEFAREQLIDGAKPWASYYAAMKQTKYASRTLGSANQGSGLGVPASDAFADASMNARLDADGAGAQTQALLYFFTGDPVYRENALKIVRIWSHLDPQKYKFYGDAQIKIGGGMYRLVQAAELLRYTSVVPSTSGYPLDWTQQDTDDFTTNFVEPATQTFAYSNAWYMNQGTLPMLGAMSGAIFTNNRERYNSRVEWFAVNAAHPNQDVNGSVAAMYRFIDKKNPLNPTNKSFVQHVEMGRDQAHAADDVYTLTALARMVDTQGTKLDPKTGAPSIKKGAVDPYKFLDNRLLKGANAFVGFMMGHEVPWVDITNQGGQLAQSYRGRGPDALNELYHVYTFREGVNVDRVAPYIAQQFEQRDGPLFYNWASHEVGTKIADDGLYSFWGGSIPGDDYWLSLPAGAEGEDVPPADSNLQLETKGSVIAGKASLRTEGDITFLRADVEKKKDTVIAVRSVLYGERKGYSPVALRVRTTDPVNLKVSSQKGAAPYHTLTIPDTDGRWRYVTYDMDTSVIPTALMGDNNIVYYTLTGANTRVDVDYVDADAAKVVTPPVFPQGTSTTLIGVAGQPLTADLSAKDSSGALTYSIPSVPKGLVLDTTDGTVTWIPRSKDIGARDVVVQADDGDTTTALAVKIRIAADRDGALALATGGFDVNTVYTSTSRARYDSAVTSAQALVKQGSYAAFARAIAVVQEAVRGLELLTPLLGDGTLNYPAVSTSTLDKNAVPALVDNDNTTFSGDLFVPSFTFDFGAAFRVKATEFELQARQTFGNRSQGANVYGSNDGSTWTKLTTRMTTNTNERETLPVDPALTDKSYRLVKVQVDEAGVVTDPNFPPIFSVAEFRIHGERVEAVNRITAASISSNNAVPGLAASGDIVTLNFTASETISQVSGTIQGQSAEVSGSGKTWTAKATLPSGVEPGTYARFAISYRTENGQVADPLQLTTDGSRLFLSDPVGLIAKPTDLATIVSLAGEPEPSKKPWAANMFDGNAATFSDVGPVGGKFYIIFDFAERGSVAFDHAELLVRQDNWGLSRASNLHLEGSNDLTTWTPVSNNAKSTLDWQLLKRPSGTAAAASYRYLKVANTDWINIAELRLFGKYTAPPSSSVTSAKLTASGSDVGGRALVGDTATLTFSSSETITAVKATIDGRPATVTGDGQSWSASATIEGEAVPARKLGFRVEYAGPNGEPRRPLESTTDGSGVFLTSNSGMIADAQNKFTGVLLNGSANATVQTHLNRLFDGNVSTFSDTSPNTDGPYLVMDFGDSHSVALNRAELLVRQDGFGTGRAADLRLEGSNDRSTWTRLTPNATATLSWQTLTKASGAPTTSFRYLRLANNNWINVAELRLFGSYE